MAARTSVICIALLLSSLGAVQATEVNGRTHGNPIRKVVTMLQNMVKKVEAEGEKEQELYEKFMCYCQKGGTDLEKSIADAKTKIPELSSGIEASVSKKTQFQKELEDHRTDKANAQKAMAEATALRTKEESDFGKESSEAKAEISQVTKALVSLDAGVSSAFLQTNAASELHRIVSSQQEMAEDDRQAVLSFLSGGAQQSAPGAIIGILGTMKEEMASGLSEAEKGEADAQGSYNELMSAKKKEVKACTRMTEEKLQRVGELATEIEMLKNELVDKKDCLVEDSKMKATLKKSCASKEGEVAKSKALRQQELVALSETIKILNDDDALEMFKKALPGSASSFLQIRETSHAVRQRALKVLQSRKPQHSVQLDFIALALRGKKVGFDGVITMVDQLVVTLQEEQAQDNKKKVYCGQELNKADGKKSDLERTISDTDSAIGKAEEDVSALGESIKSLTAGIKALDASVAEATTQRKEEHSEYSEVMASDGTAKEILGFAKNRLQKFYNPKLYAAPPKRELSEEDQITVNNGGTLAPTAPPGGIGGTGIGAASFVQVSASYNKAESSGVLRMIDLLIADLDKDMTEAEVTEKDSQADYEQAMKDAAAKRASDSKALAESQAEQADLASSLEELMAAKKSSKKELAATNKYIMALHSDCDWLLQYFDVRKEARAGEVDSLTKAKAVLSGADYSFLQLRSQRFLA